MSDAEIVAAAEALFREGARKVLAGELPKHKQSLLNTERAAKILESLGAEDNRESDSNGWQHDWWESWSYKGKDFTLAGSSYYGGISIYPKES